MDWDGACGRQRSGTHTCYHLKMTSWPRRSIKLDLVVVAAREEAAAGRMAAMVGSAKATVAMVGAKAVGATAVETVAAKVVEGRVGVVTVVLAVEEPPAVVGRKS